MRTYIISRDEIKDMPVVAEGYKVFNYDWSTNQNNYMYADPNTGTAVGTIHKTEGDMEKCVCGSHFCVNPADCIKYYATLTWNKFAKVRAYGKVKGDSKDSKMAAEILEIVKEISFDELMEEIKKYDYAYGCYDAYGCNDVSGCSYAHGCNDAYGCYDAHGCNYAYGCRNVSGCNDVSGCYDAYGCNDVSGCSYAHGCRNVSGCSYAHGCRNVSGCNYAYGCNDVSGCSYAHGCRNVSGCYDAYGCSYAHGCYDAYFCDNCEGISRCICCTSFTGKLAVFNAEITEKEFEEIKARIFELSGGWYPKFNNAFDLYNKVGEKWEKVPANIIAAKSKKEAYADMPKKLKKYLKSLPQFNAEIWEQITGENA